MTTTPVSQKNATRVLAQLSEEQGRLLSLAVTKDGKGVITGGDHGEIVLWDSAKGKQLATLASEPHSNWIWKIAVRDDGMVAASSKAHCVWVGPLKAKLKRVQRSVPKRPWIVVQEDLFDAQFLPDGRLVTVGVRAEIQIWDVIKATSVLIDANDPEEDFRTVTVVGPNRVVTGSWHGRLSLWDLKAKKKIASHKHKVAIEALACLNGQEILVGDSTGKITLFTVDDLQAKQVYSGHSGAIQCLTVHPDGHRFASASRDGSVRIWDKDELRTSRCFTDNSGRDCSAVAFDPKGTRLFWTAGKRVLTQALTGKAACDAASPVAHTRGVEAFAYLPDVKQLVSIGRDGALCVWNPKDKKLVQRFALHSNAITTVLDLGGGRVATGGDDELMVISDVAKGPKRKISHKQKYEPGQLAGLWLAPNGNIVSAARLAHNDLFMWDAGSGKRLPLPELVDSEQADVVAVVASSTNHRQLIALDELGGITLWKLGTKRAVTWFGDGRGWALSKNGARAFIGDEAVQCIDVATKKPVYRLATPANLRQFSLDASNRHAVAVGQSATIVYDARKGRVLGKLKGDYQVAAWSPSGSALMLARARKLVLWSLKTKKVVATATMPWEISAVLLLNDKRGVVGSAGGCVEFFSA